MIEPYSFTISSLRNTYSFEPVPKGAVPSLIKGAQGNLWTEQVYNSRHLQYMLWPRGMALAEVIWSPAGQRDWSDFQRRVEEHFQRLDERGVKYSKSLYDPTFEIMVKGNDSLFVKLSVEAENLKIHYSVDNTHPDAFYPVYDGPIYIPKEASMLKVVTSRKGRIMGRQIDFPVTEMLDRVKHRDGPKAKANREKKKYKNVIAAQAAVIIALLLSIFLMARKIRARSRG